MAASSILTPHAPTGAALPEPDAMAGHLGLYFPDRAGYARWAVHIDAEAPGVRARLLTVNAPDGRCAVFFRLADGTPLTPDGADALIDAARRLGSDQSERGAET